MRIYLYCLFLIFLTGCEALTTQPLHAAWYLSFEDDASKPSGNEEQSGVTPPNAATSASASTAGPVMYVALLNRSNRVIDVKDIEINRVGDERKSAWSLMKGGRQKSASDEEVKKVLHPGRLVLLRTSAFMRTSATVPEVLESFDATKCHIPVEVSIILAAELPLLEKWINRAHGDSFGTIRADLVGRMPSSLPSGWNAGTCKFR